MTRYRLASLAQVGSPKLRTSKVHRGFVRFLFNRLWILLLMTGIAVGAQNRSLSAAVVSEAERLLWTGQYEACREMAAAEVARGVVNERWPELLIRAQLARGAYADAEKVYQQAVVKYADRIPLKLWGYEVYRRTNQPQKAERELDQIFQLASRAPWRFGGAAEQVALGRFFALRGEDARQILELIYDKVRQRQPNFAEVYIAAGELALSKQDYAVAAEQLTAAARLQPNDPQVHYLLGEALAASDSQRALASMQRALELNPRHVPTLLWQVDQLIDAEQYERAKWTLSEVLQVNLYEPMAWAYHAVIAHLEGHFSGEQALHAAAVSCWQGNYELDHRMGWKLSQKYRFADGAAYQSRALATRPDYLPAKFALAQDLLRLGRETEGWRLAAEVQQQDQYHVVAYNLMELRRELDRFKTLGDENFVIRMDATEADVYGSRVLRLLQSAYVTLTSKYDCAIQDPVYVEIFPRQQDFAIRTFGLPGGSGYLGVCFGHLITANSPASRGTGRANWESVLWHEFCHVVTLQKTQNRMPRWLSEGISVYEERQRDPAWGQSMTPTYRKWILTGQMTPVSQLSGAFLRPASAEHLQFAYFESSLVVDYLIQEFGLDALRRILNDLSVGMPIRESLQRYTGSPEQLDAGFEAYAREKAQQLGAGLDWEAVELDADDSLNGLLAKLTTHPRNYRLALRAAALYRQQEKWAEIVSLLEPLYELYPNDTSSAGILRQLSEAYRQLGRADDERRILEQWLTVDDDPLEACQRLIELAEARQDAASIDRYLQKMLAVNPLLVSLQKRVAENARALEREPEFIEAQKALLALGPEDLAVTHYELAAAYHRLGDSSAARLAVLQALEEAPRYRDAQRLLLTIVDADKRAETGGSDDSPSSADPVADTPVAQP